jgi:hemerythrin superfamily protein
MDLDAALNGKPSEGASAVEILRADHREVSRLFQEFAEDRGEPLARKVAARSICLQIELHDAIEREVFYPALRESQRAKVDWFLHEHDEVMRIVLDVRDREEWDDPCDAAMLRLATLVERHAREEEDELFPLVEAMDAQWLRELGSAIVSQKEALTRSTEEFEGPAT